MLTQDRLRQILHYDPDTGVFTRIKKQTGVRQGAIAGSLSKEGYLVTSVDCKVYKCHRLAWLYMTGSWPANHIDHKDGNKANNRFYNLRDVTKSQNMQNQRKAQAHNKATQLLGVYKNGVNFAARIWHNNTRVYLGTFATKEEAHAAYLAAKRLLHSTCTI